MKQFFTFLFTATLTTGLLAQQTGSFIGTYLINGGATIDYYVPTNYNASTAYKLIVNLEKASQGHYTGYSDTANAIVAGTDLSNFQHLSDLVDSTALTYNINYDCIYLTGFSAKGYTTLLVGLDNPAYFAGLLPLAPAGATGLNYTNSTLIPTCIVTGSNDQFLTETGQVFDNITNVSGIVDSAIVQGVGHQPAGPDARTPRIAECFNFINANKSTSGIAHLQQEQGLYVFPNPSKGAFTVRSKQQGTFSVIDLAGKQVATGNLNQLFNMSEYPKGLYFVQHNGQTQKLVLVE